MRRKPVWVRDDIVIAINHRQIAEHGGQAGIRDLNLLASALAKPKNLYHYSKPKPTLTQLAAAYAFGLSRNHPFIDGNKRLSLTICDLFLELNNAEIKVMPSDKYKTYMKLAAGKLTESEMAHWLERHLVFNN